MSEQEEQDFDLDEAAASSSPYKVKLVKTTNPKDVTDDMDQPVKATQKHYEIHKNGKSVGKVTHHYDEYSGHSYSANLHGKKVPFDRSKMGEGEGAQAFIDGVAKTKWHTKSIKEEFDLDEATSVAGDTLHAGSKSFDDPMSKVEAMKHVLSAVNGMSKEDMTKWFHQSMALIGKEASSLPAGANADANQSSVDMTTGKGPKTRDPMPKLSVKEDVDEMFSGEELSEEFKDKASTLFEAAVAARSALEVARLEEQYEALLEEQVLEITEELQTNLDSYLSYAAEKWMEENQVAIESTLRNEVMEEFLDGLKNLFTEHYIDIPEDKANVVESLAAKVEALEEALDETINENAQLKSVILESNKQEVLDELAEGLTMTQAEKFFALAEGIEFDGDLDVYAKKLSVVKENYFTKTAKSTYMEEETFEGTQLTESFNASIDPSVNRYVQAISRTVKK
jgi:hypothetical protein